MTLNAKKFSGSILEIITCCVTNFTRVDDGLRKTVKRLLVLVFRSHRNSSSFQRPEWNSIPRIYIVAYKNTLQRWSLFTGDCYLYVYEDLKRWEFASL